MLRFGDGILWIPGRRRINRNLSANGIALFIRPRLIAETRATTNQIRTNRNVSLLMRPNLAISLLELLDNPFLFRRQLPDNRFLGFL